MLRADIKSTRNERHHAQQHTDELQSGEWFSWYTPENTEPCRLHNLTCWIPCWRAEVADAKDEVNAIIELIEQTTATLQRLAPVPIEVPGDEPTAWTNSEKGLVILTK